MSREQILKKAEEIIKAYGNDPQEVVQYYQGSKNPFLLVSKEDYRMYQETDDPIFDLLLGLDMLFVGYISLNDIKTLYQEAGLFVPKNS